MHGLYYYGIFLFNYKICKIILLINNIINFNCNNGCRV